MENQDWPIAPHYSPGDSDDFGFFLLRSPRPGDSQIYPCSFLRTRFDQWSFLFVLVCLGHMYMEINGWGYFNT